MIEATRDGALLTLRLNRPDKANSLSRDMLRELRDQVRAAGADEGVKALILTGAGDRVFSAGADLEEARAGGLATDPVWEELSGAIAELPILSLAALNGTLAGGAFGMALACDLRIAVPEARFFYPVAKLGFLPQPSDPPRLAALVGPARARMILVAGEKIGAEEALAWGLVDRLVPAAELMDVARGLVADACAGDRAHLAAIKRLF